MRKQYQTARGVPVNIDDMDQDTLAIGNLGGGANINARGDILGKAGKVVQPREEVIAKYYAEALPETARQPLSQEIKTEEPVEFLSPSEAIEELQKQTTPKPKKGTSSGTNRKSK